MKSFFEVNSLQVATVSLMSSYVARCFENMFYKYVTMYIVSRNLPYYKHFTLFFSFILIVALNNVLAEDCALSRTGTNYKGMSSIVSSLHELAGRLIQLDLKMSLQQATFIPSI